MKKFIVGICIVLFGFLVGCVTTSAVPEPQPGDPADLHTRAAMGRGGVVSAAMPEASEIGIEILRRGGNAVDAAVAVGFALGVIEPNASGLGGGGYMIIRLAGMDEAVVLDFRDTAPAAAHQYMYLDADGNVVPNAISIGALAIATPGQVAGLLHALENFGSGRLTRQQIMQPAIDFAENGFVVTENSAINIVNAINLLNRFEATSEIFTDFGLPLEAGDILRQPDLADTLRIIAEGGADAFYRGPLAARIAEAVQDLGGILTVEDMANYEVRVRRPVVGTYRGYTIISTPPSSSGGMCIIQIFNMLENMDSRELRFGETQAVHAWLQAFRLTFADRARWMADTDFIPVPLEGLTSKEYARELFSRFDPTQAMLSAEAGDPTRFESDPGLFIRGYTMDLSERAELERASTTSFSIMDRAGNVVTVTTTINSFFGSGVTVPGTGILMNNQMASGFVSTPGQINSPHPNKRPLSSMSPTLVLDPRGRPFMTLGSPGATRIFPTIALVISHVIDNGMSVQEAINAPRWFTMQSGQVHVEGRLPDSTIQELRDLGYDVNVRPYWDLFFGGVHAVHFDHPGQFGRRGTLHGGADPRRDGFARGF